MTRPFHGHYCIAAFHNFESGILDGRTPPGGVLFWGGSTH